MYSAIRELSLDYLIDWLSCLLADANKKAAKIIKIKTALRCPGGRCVAM